MKAAAALVFEGRVSVDIAEVKAIYEGTCVSKEVRVAHEVTRRAIGLENSCLLRRSFSSLATDSGLPYQM
ncbi:hypothetical protein Q3G72_017930 [Acer saccharum]|nr:hypothetical protein Q3G72_017930 [Acer saccharum]